MSHDVPVARQLRMLAALELELELLFAEKVAEARQTGLAWDVIAAAVGVSRPSAWRRWKPVVDDPRTKRPIRRDGREFTLSERDEQSVRDLTDALVKRVISRRERHPYSSAVRASLDQLKQTYEVRRLDSQESHFQVRGDREGHQILVACLEPNYTSGQGGDVVVTTLPSLRRGTYEQPKSVRLDLPGSAELDPTTLSDRISSFLADQLEGARDTTSGSESGQPS